MDDDDEATTRANEDLGLAAVRAALRAAESMSYEGFARLTEPCESEKAAPTLPPNRPIASETPSGLSRSRLPSPILA